MKKQYQLSIRCYYPNCDRYTHHLQTMGLKDIGKWIEAYQFTHPAVEAITIKINLNGGETA